MSVTEIQGEASKQPAWWVRVLIGRNPKVTLVRMVISVLLLLVLDKFVFLPIRVMGISMQPTYTENRIDFVNRLAYLFHSPQRGDIVSIQLAGKHVMYCKRIVALPGETVAFHEGRLLINGQVLEEPYVKGPCNWEHEPEAVGPNEYYVVGDNRTMDFYDHEQGRAERSRIVGKLLL
jgi:signal peptidase I